MTYCVVKNMMVRCVVIGIVFELLWDVFVGMMVIVYSKDNFVGLVKVFVIFVKGVFEFKVKIGMVVGCLVVFVEVENLVIMLSKLEL